VRLHDARADSDPPDELRGLRRADIDLLDGVLRVRGTKTEAAERSIALSPILVGALEDHYRRTVLKGESEFVFCHPDKGSRYSA
jgi:integrase